MLLNSKKFYDSLFFLGQLLVYTSSVNEDGTCKKSLKLNEFSYSDILNIDRLTSSHKPSTIDYNQICRSLFNQSIETIWLSLFTNECLAICFQIRDENQESNKIIMKLMDNNGQLLKEKNNYNNCELVTMNTCNKYVVLAIRCNSIFQLHLNELLVNNIKTISLNYEPILIHCTECFIYVLSNKAPFIHVHDWSLVEYKTFGQDLDSSSTYFMSIVTQIFVRNEKLYARDQKNAYIKVFELHTGILLKIIDINLLDCLLHIDSIERIIVINQDSKILYIFDELANILFEYDLTFIHTISSFCVTYNGHLLLNDTESKILHVI